GGLLPACFGLAKNHHGDISMKLLPLSVLIGSVGFTRSAAAAEGFQIRHNSAGSLGGEMFVPPEQSGSAVGIAATHVQITKVTGADGGTLHTSTPAGTVAVPGSPSAVSPSYG
ncbi:hypothetical protein OY671_010322, partial [Metschnikowia pulcherrima]